MGPIEQSMRERVIEARKRMARAAAVPVIAAPKRVLIPPPPQFKPVPPLEASLRKKIPWPKVNKTVLEVCERHGVNPLLVAGNNRERPVVAARNEIFSILNAQGLSLLRLGMLFGKDHSTVLYAIRKHRGLPQKPSKAKFSTVSPQPTEIDAGFA